MKTFVKLMFLLAVLCMANGCSKQDEICDENGCGLQLNSADNRTIVSRYGPGEVPTFWCPVICDGEIVDYLTGDRSTITVWVREKYQDGNIVRMLINASGHVQSLSTGIKYTFTEQDKIYLDEDGAVIFFKATDNVKGDQGTHFIFCYFVLDFDAGTFEITKAMCVPNADNKDL